MRRLIALFQNEAFRICVVLAVAVLVVSKDRPRTALFLVAAPVAIAAAYYIITFCKWFSHRVHSWARRQHAARTVVESVAAKMATEMTPHEVVLPDVPTAPQAVELIPDLELLHLKIGYVSLLTGTFMDLCEQGGIVDETLKQDPLPHPDISINFRSIVETLEAVEDSDLQVLLAIPFIPDSLKQAAEYVMATRQNAVAYPTAALRTALFLLALNRYTKMRGEERFYTLPYIFDHIEWAQEILRNVRAQYMGHNKADRPRE